MIVLETTTPKARKQHKCSYCGQIIKIGETYEQQTNIGDDGLYHWKSHISCQKLVDKLDMYKYCSDDGVTSDDFYESIIQEYYDIMKAEIGNLISINKDVIFKDKLKFVKDYYKL